MEGKKISFGFMKSKKTEKPIAEERKDFIECVEEKSIKVVGGEEIKENTPLIIPMKPNTLVTAERLKQVAEEVESAIEEPEAEEKPPISDDKPPENETLEQMAIRELMQEAKKEVKVETPALLVPLPAKPVNVGEKESTLDDYEAVPIQDFGLAMLRGMGWTPNKEKSKYKPPQLRPKGLGLGADKVVKVNQKQRSTKDGKDEELTIVENAYVKITTGKYSGYYGKVLSLDEDNGRVMVDIAFKKETVSLSEFAMHPVTKAEFDKESKVINAGSFEEYKKQETKQQPSKNTEREGTPNKSTIDRNIKDDTKYSEKEATSSKDRENKSSRKTDREHDLSKNSKNGKSYKDETSKEKDVHRSNRSRQRGSSEERSTRKKNRRHSSSGSLSSLSDTEQKRSKKKERKQYSSQESLSSEPESDKRRYKKKEKKKRDSESDHKSKRDKTPEGKRDIDKKRKGKKKKRDRDRSPNYRKHRK